MQITILNTMTSQKRKYLFPQRIHAEVSVFIATDLYDTDKNEIRLQIGESNVVCAAANVYKKDFITEITTNHKNNFCHALSSE